MTARRTFASSCASAELRAWQAASPFTPSRAEHEAALADLVSELRDMPDADAQAYVRATYDNRGLMPLAVRLYKEATREPQSV
jgi:nitrate reductase assembly molybdenum cofactor insertion protein NarJ